MKNGRSSPQFQIYRCTSAYQEYFSSSEQVDKFFSLLIVSVLWTFWNWRERIFHSWKICTDVLVFGWWESLWNAETSQTSSISAMFRNVWNPTSIFFSGSYYCIWNQKFWLNIQICNIILNSSKFKHFNILQFPN